MLPACRASRPTASATRFHLQRLKDKLGNRSNASCEVEFRGAWARLVGEEGRGVPTIIEMVNHTRLDCALGVGGRVCAGAPRRRSTTRSHRSAFGKPLVEQPLMQNVLADLAIESEAATIGAMRLARAYDEAHAGDEQRDRAPAPRQRRCSSTGPASGRRSTRSRRSSAWAATATSRSRGCRASTARARSPRSGRGRATCQCLDVLRAMARNPAGRRGVRRRGRRGSGGRAPARRVRAPAARRPRLRSRDARDPRPRRGRADGAGATGLAAGPLRRSGESPTPSAPRAWPATPAAPSAPCPPGTDFGRIIERHALGI